MPAFCANWPRTSGPSTLRAPAGSTGLLGPAATQDDMMSPRPPLLKAPMTSAEAAAAADGGVLRVRASRARPRRSAGSSSRDRRSRRAPAACPPPVTTAVCLRISSIGPLHLRGRTPPCSSGNRPIDGAATLTSCRRASGRRRMPVYSSTRSTARKASCGMSTVPTRFIRFLPSFCFSSSFRLRRDVAAVALGDDVLAQRLHGLAGDDARADGGLDRHLEHLPRDQLAASSRPGSCRAGRPCPGGR